ncbi:MAG: hypothetical protein NC429_06705 [Lachnospiraceae bacterium]|nr:hypothetical protein [Lachnospiraceae bacterium]
MSGLMLLKKAPLPQDILKLGAGGVNQIWRDGKVRAAGIKRAQTLIEAAQNSTGLKIVKKSSARRKGNHGSARGAERNCEGQCTNRQGR